MVTVSATITGPDWDWGRLATGQDYMGDWTALDGRFLWLGLGSASHWTGLHGRLDSTRWKVSMVGIGVGYDYGSG